MSDEEFKVLYPEHAKLPSGETRAALHRMFAWLEEYDYAVCYVRTFTDSDEREWWPVGMPVNEMIERAFGANPQKVEAERRKMLQTFLDGK